jgi:3-hydroxymyristoyl/3-hydroxydecanoyl-(acyl carrier protein) dehydratase
VFHFVDQILELDPGRHALGVKRVTSGDTFVRPSGGGEPALLSCIIGEALGQLGAWNVMASNGFTFRPVAGVVGEVAIFGEATVGDTILLDTTIDSATNESVIYHAAASVDGETVLRLEDAIGPMLPIEQFNDPEELRQRFERIQRTEPAPEIPHTDGEATVPFDPSFDEILSFDPGIQATAIRNLGGGEAYLADHFPNKPVLPLSLLLESLLQLGQNLIDDGDTPYVPTGVQKVKMNRFVEPACSLVAKVRVARRDTEEALLKFRCELDGARVCVGEASYSAILGEGR